MSRADKNAEVETIRAALKSAPKDAKPALAALLKMFNRLGGSLVCLSTFAEDMNAKNVARNKRLDGAEERLVEIERRLASLETRQAVTEMRSAKP